MITYEFNAEINGAWCGGSFTVEAKNYEKAKEKADDVIAKYLRKAPGDLTFDYLTECCGTNADEVFEEELKEAIAKYGEDHIDLAYVEGKVSIMYHSSKNSFSVFSLDEDEFCFENNTYSDPEYLIEDLAEEYHVGLVTE